MKKTKLLILAGCLSLPLQAFAGVAIIANPDISIDTLSVNVAKDIFLCKTKYLGDGEKVVFSYQEEGSNTRKEFNKVILGKSATSIKRHWSKIKFTGECDQPVIHESDEAVRAWVKATPGAVGYIDSQHVTKDDNVLLKK